MKTNSKKRLNGEGIENSTRDLDLEGIVGNMLISQYQLQILRYKLADSLDGWWLSQDRGRNSFSHWLQFQHLPSASRFFLR
jgi:hypothetical protein